MATLRWYLVNGVDANGWQALSTTAQTAADTAAGWVVGTGATFSSELQAGAERSAGFTANTVPDATLDTSLKDAFRIPLLPGGGSFASANWTFQFTVVSPTQGGAADGQIVFRLIKANADGSSATEITVAQQSASVCTNVGSTDLGTAANVGTLTFNPGAITLAAGQYLFVQIAWKRTGAGGMTTTNIRFRTGSSTTVGTSILSADFTPANQTVTGATLASTAVVRAPGLPPSQSVTGAFIGGGGAPVGFVRLGSSKAGTPNALTFTTPSFTVPVGTTLLVGVLGELTGTPCVLTNNHGDTVVIGAGQDPGTLDQARAFWIINPTPDAAYTLTATRAGNFYPSLCWAWYSGGHPTAPFVMDTDGQNGVLAAPLVPTEDGCLLIAGSIHQQAGTTTTLLTEIQDQAFVGGTSFGTSLAEEIQTTATSRNPTITTVDVIVGVVFKPAAGGGGSGAVLYPPGVSAGASTQTISGATLISGSRFFDAFTGSGALTSDWTSTALSASATVVRVSGEATASAVDAAQITSAYVSGLAFPADQYAQAKITAVPGGESNHFCNLLVRASGSDTTFDGYLGGTNGNRIFLAKLIHNRAWTPLVDFPVHPGGIAVGDIIRLEAEGTTVRLKQNGTTIASATDSTLTSGAPGIGFLETASILARSDDFEAGTLGSTTAVLAGSVSVGGATTQAIGGATIGGDFDILLEDGSFLLLEDGSSHLLVEPSTMGTSQVFPGTVFAVPASQAVTGATRASTATLFPGIVAPGPVTVTGTTRPSTATLFSGQVTTTTLVSGATIASGATVFPGRVSALVGGATLASTATLFPGAIAVNILGAHRSSTVQLFAGSLAPSGAFLPSTAQVFPGTVLLIGALAGATVPSTAQVFPGSITTGAVTVSGATLASTATVFPGSVTTTTAVSGATIAPTAALFPGAVAPGAVTIIGATLTSTASLFPGQVTTGAVTLSGATIASTATLFPGQVTPPAATVTGATIASSTTLFPGRVFTGIPVIGAIILSGSTLFPGLVTPGPVTILGATLTAPDPATHVFPGHVATATVICAVEFPIDTDSLIAPTSFSRPRRIA